MQTLVGVWKLVSARAFDRAGNELLPPLGSNPMGVITYGPERMAVVVCDGVSGGSFNSYCGRYELHGEELVVYVDAASNPSAERVQVRSIVFEGPGRYVAHVDAGSAGTRELSWERIG